VKLELPASKGAQVEAYCWRMGDSQITRVGSESERYEGVLGVAEFLGLF
jgi:hypothetical protein